MRLKIQDEFANLPISRQRKHQLRMQRDQQCTECGEHAVMGSRCLKHLVKARERQRKKRGLKRRYLNTLSYKLQQGPEVRVIPAPQSPAPVAKSESAKTAPKSKAATRLPRQSQSRSRQR